MSDFVKLQIKTLEQIRQNKTIHDYHQAFGVLFDVLTDILGLAKQPDNHTAEGSEYGKCLFAGIAALSQHCAEGMRLCIPTNEQIDEDKLPKFLCWIILQLLDEIENNQQVISNPMQQGSLITVTQIDQTKIEAIKDFLNEREDLLSATRSQPLQPFGWPEQAEGHSE